MLSIAPSDVLASSSGSEGFSVPLLVAAAAVALGWFVVVGVLGVIRRPPRVRAAATGMELPTESPAVAGMLASGFVLPAEAAPAILLDLAARKVVDLDEVQPGKTICRVPARVDEPLADYERRVLDAVSEKAIDGIVPTEALTTGPEERSSAWHRALAKEIIADAHGRGLTRDRWPRPVVGALAIGLGAVIALIALAAEIGGDPRGDQAAVAWVAGAIAGGVAVVGALVLTRLGRSLAQVPTPSGLDAAARAEGLEEHLREDSLLAELPPAAVAIRGRHFAYAAAFGAAPLAVALLPMGAEDDHRAWSRAGGRWRRVLVRYPRAWPPAWGMHPVLAILAAVAGAVLGSVAVWALARVAGSTRPVGLPQRAWDSIGAAALVTMAPFGVLLVWSLTIAVRAVPDLWGRSEVTGEIVRDRKFRQRSSSGDRVHYRYYLAVDDGSHDRIRAWRMRESLWREFSQGETVRAEITPNLGYVRTMEHTSD